MAPKNPIKGIFVKCMLRLVSHTCCMTYLLLILSDNCKKTAVVLDGAIGTVEFINCQSVQCQVS